MKFAVGITLYNPTEHQIKKIEEYTKCFDVVFVYDNSENGHDEHKKMLNIEKVEYITEKKNMGLPIAFNTILDNKHLKGIDFLCTLDQDSRFDMEDIERIKKYIREECRKMDRVGIVAPNIDYGKGNSKRCNLVEKRRWVITSGAFLNLRMIEKFNLRYDVNYFIDKFEIDLCEQMIKKGLEIRMYHGAVLYQRLGEITKSGYSGHNALRHYYLFRNRFYFNKKFYGLLKCCYLDLLQTMRHIFLIMLYEEHKWKKVKQLLPAWNDYRQAKMGMKETIN